jgi:large subunit ribosomal protein L25
MTEILAIQATARGDLGTGNARAARRAGSVPAIIYGNNLAPTPITIAPRPIEVALNKPGFYTKLFDVTVGDTTVRTVVRAIQFHPVNDRILHLDFQRVDPNSTIRVEVPLVFADHAESLGLKSGGVLNVILHSVALDCAIDKIPSNISISLAGADLGHAMHLGDLPLPDGTTLSTTEQRDNTIYAITGATNDDPEDATAE